MLLSEIFKNAPSINIEQLSSDSRLPMKDAIFFCISGLKYDGHDYIDEAVKNGAKVVVYSKDIEKSEQAIYVKVKNVDDVMIQIAKKFYNYPTNNMQSFVVSGCYGRSSVSTLIYRYLNSVTKAGYIGRFGILYEQTSLSLSHPTLPIIDNLRYLNTMNKVNVKAVTFEASSSSLAYRKLDFIKPNIFVYTNSFEDSSDYREAGEDYFKNMRRYLYSLEDKTKVVLNSDDKAFEELKDCVNNFVTYGFNENADYYIHDLVVLKKGIKFFIRHQNKDIQIVSKLLSVSNCYNLAAAIVSLIEIGYDIKSIIDFYSTCNYVDGVFEVIDDKYHVVVDSSYTFDSLSEVFDYGYKVKSNCQLISLISISSWSEKEVVEKILNIANNTCDKIILTVDENENNDNYKLLTKNSEYFDSNKTIIIEDREVAIETGINLLNEGDIFLITGKGNENYLITGDGRIPYQSDKTIALKYIEQRRNEENEII